jgi:hypothetical protein
MVYRFEASDRNYADLASGAVLHSAPGFPAFPVRLASEMFLRGLAHIEAKEPVTIWDPCCGSGYLVTVLALRHRSRVREVIASDIDDAAVALARRNLALLTGAGLSTRAAELAALAGKFGKSSYAEAADAAVRLAEQLASSGGDVPSAAHVADVFDTAQVAAALDGRTAQVVITDVPYGEQTDWQGVNAGAGTPGMVRAVASIVPAETVLIVAVRGRKVPLGDQVRPIERFKIGTRSVAIARAGDLRTSLPLVDREGSGQ